MKYGVAGGEGENELSRIQTLSPDIDFPLFSGGNPYQLDNLQFLLSQKGDEILYV